MSRGRNGPILVRVARRILLSGIVQGVGLRPFLARTALRAGVAGYVKNLGGGDVFVHVEGETENVEKFFGILKTSLPPPAEIWRVVIEEAEPLGLTSFSIEKSEKRRLVRSMIPPDMAACPHCLGEVEDPRDRRRGYPFNSCAWCGPRYSMMYSVPYDRENTSMRHFPLCEECRREYEDVWNERRYHAEGISCPKCGPRVWLEDSRGEKIEAEDPIALAASLISEGRIVAVKGIGGFHVACRADEDSVVEELRRRKRRPQQPFALMALSAEEASRLVELSEESRRILESSQRPILILPKRPGAPVSELVAPGLDSLGVMLPYTPLHYLLLKSCEPKFLIMTSGNSHGKPMVVDNEAARRELREIVDYFLLHDRPIVNRVDDSVLRFTGGSATMLRRGRGYAPRWIELRGRLERGVIAFGAELQAAGGVGFDDKAVLTQFIGDVDDADALAELKLYVERLAEFYGVRYEDSVIVVDKHPKYASSALGRRLARRHGSELLEVQHHVAHALSAMAETGDEVGVAIAIDGVGYGDDGNAWGGEVLAIHGGEGYERVGHLQYHKMLGGDLAALRPLRMTFSMAASELGAEEAASLLSSAGLADGAERLELLAALHERERILTSSAGRFLDAVSAMLGICRLRTYEGEPAIKLEAFARGGSLSREVLELVEAEREGGSRVVRTSPLVVSWLRGDLRGRVSARDLAFSAQYAVGFRLGELAAEKALEIGVERVHVSGGAAVNELIYRGIIDALASASGGRLRAHVNRLVPPGDGGIALGQIYAVLLGLASER